MTDMISRRLFLSGAAGLALTGPACANAPARSLTPVARGEDLRLRNLLTPDQLITRAELGGHVGFCVADSRSGEILETHAADRGLPPASVAKALTAGYALDQLGAEHRFETQVIATGGVSGGVVQGDLVLAGGGDPTLETDMMATLASRVKAAGITEVRGGLKVWGGALASIPTIDATQPDHVGYSPAISGLNLNFNRVHFEWRRAGGDYNVTMDARSAAHRPAVRMARMAIEPRSAPIYTYADRGGHDAWTVARNALGKGGARWLPVRKPELYAGEVFQSFLRAQGVSVGAPQVVSSRPSGDVVATVASPPLRDVLREMLKFSTNITAEAVGMAATRASTGKPPATLKASAAAMNAWAAQTLGARGLALVDHSGLGDRSRVGAAQMMAALQRMQAQPGYKPLLKAFPMRDKNRKIIKNHPIDVHAKTGTLNFVSGLGGFAKLSGGRELVFAIFAADMDRRAGLSKAERERPPGGVSWNRRAKALQQALIERWDVVYGA